MFGLNKTVPKAITLFVTVTIFIQIFYAVMANQNLYVNERYFLYGYAVHTAYYCAIFLVIFLFVALMPTTSVLLRTIHADSYNLNGMNWLLHTHQTLAQYSNITNRFPTFLTSHRIGYLHSPST